MSRLMSILVVALVSGSMVAAASAAARPDGTITQAAWAHRANSICTKAHQQYLARPVQPHNPPTLDDILEVMHRVVPTIVWQTNAIKALPVPPGRGTTVAKIVTGSKTVVSLWNSTFAARAAEDYAKVQQVLSQAALPQTKAVAAAFRQMGATSCASNFS